MEITTITPFLRYFDNVRERTMRVAGCIPPGKIDWTYAPGKFTLGDLLRHIAVTERYMFAENVQNHESRYTSHGTELAADFDSVIELMKRLHAESLAIFSKLTDEDLKRKCKTPGCENSNRQMAARHGRPGGASPRPNLSLPRFTWRAHAATLRPDFRRSSRRRPRRINFVL